MGETLVGRADELRVILSECRRAAEGRGSLVVVSGDSGIGKTRLCQEVELRARDTTRVVMARCWDYGGAPPLWPWQPILRELCGDDATRLLASETDSPQRERDRFARFVAVVDRLAAACRRQPTCLIIDDIHAADADALLLARFVARSLHHLRLAMVLSRRTALPAPGGLESRLLDEIEGEATLVTVPAFDLDETAAFLSTHGVDSLGTDDVRVLQRVTGGHPLFLRRLVANHRASSAGDVARGVREAMELAIRRLSPATRSILRTSAVLGNRVVVADVAALARTDPASVLAASAEAASAGLVDADGTGQFSFSHEQVRSALDATLSGTERLEIHARAAAVVARGLPEASIDRLTRRAHHALAAAPLSAAQARMAAEACQAAARSMVDGFAYEQADKLLSAAVMLHDDASLGTPPAHLLLAWAQAALLRGSLTEARRRFDRAATAAEREGDGPAFAEAALGLGGHGVNELRGPVHRRRVLGVQRAALARLPEGRSPLRSRLSTRLAAEAVYDGAPLAPMHEALEAARRCGDPLALAEALSLTHQVLSAPRHFRSRLALADELVDVAAQAGLDQLALIGLCLRVIDLFHLGDDRAARALHELRVRADALECQSILYILGLLDVMLLMRAGRLDEAEHEARGCFEHGRAIGDEDATPYLAAHELTNHWLRGDAGEVVEVATEMASSPTVVPSEFSFSAAVAAFAARAGQVERARAALDRVTENGLDALPLPSSWLVGMLAIVDAAASLGDAAVARQAYDLLLPFAGLPMVASRGIACFGSTERTLGVAAATVGDHAAAVRHFERAMAANRRLGNRPLLTISRADLAIALRARGETQDRDRSVRYLDASIREADTMGLSGWVGRWVAELDASQPVNAGAAPGGRDSAVGLVAAAGVRHGVFRRTGRGWLVVLERHRAFVSDLLGMTYLQELLTNPGASVPALALASGTTLAAGRARHELLDEQARASYAARVQELTEELAEAEARTDLGRAERIQDELEALVSQLEAATGLAGRPRVFQDEAELARTSVRKAIKRAIDAIDARSSAIAGLLRSSVSTGALCSYTPDPRNLVVWSNAAPIDQAEATASVI